MNYSILLIFMKVHVPIQSNYPIFYGHLPKRLAKEQEAPKLFFILLLSFFAFPFAYQFPLVLKEVLPFFECPLCKDAITYY